MHDYLNQLVNRSQQPGLGVQPRPVSRFEISQESIFTASDPTETTSDNLEYISQQQLSEPNVSAAGQPTSAKDHENRLGQAIQLSRADQYQAVTVSTPDDPGKKDGKAKSQSAQHSVDALPDQSIHSASDMERSVENDQVAVSEPSIEKQAYLNSTKATIQKGKAPPHTLVSFIAPNSIEHSQKQTPEASLTQSAKPSEKKQAHAETTDIEPLFEWKPSAQTQSVFSEESRQAIIKPLTEPMAPPHATESTGNNPAPTIQITIGRIEVRATAAATATKKIPAKSPAMSLDDYLRQRQTGGRT